MIKKAFLLVFGLLFLVGSAQALVCCGIAPASYTDVNLALGQPHYFSFTVYNTTSNETAECEPGTYDIEVSVKEENVDLDELVDCQFEFRDQAPNESVFLGGGQTTKMLLTVTPKKNFGSHTLLVTAVRRPEGNGMMGVVNSACARIEADFMPAGATELAEKPFWAEFKNCPDGAVVRLEENCPGEESAPEPLALQDLSWWGLLLIVIIIFGFAFYKFRKRKGGKGKKGAHSWGLG